MSGFARACTLVVALGLVPLAAQSATPVLSAAWRDAFIPNGFADGELTPFTSDAPAAAPALRISTTTITANPWDRRLLALGGVKVAAGDTGLVRFRMRTVNMAGKPGYAKVVVESANQPYNKSVEWSLKVDGDWRQYEVPFHFAENYPASLYTVEFWLPYAPQTIEITEVAVQHYGVASYSSLGLANYPYVGHEAGAAWRSAAQQRIEQIRKGDITVVVRDSTGKPIPNAPVHLRMKRHAFAFGSAVSADWLRNGTADGEQYRNQIVKLFNAAVLENDLKWVEWESDKTRALLGLAWLKTSGIGQVRGHNVIWPDWVRMPSDVGRQSADADALRSRINKHIDEVVGSTRGLVTDWDVVNEPASANVLEPILGSGEMTKWFQQTHARDGAPRLYVNDYSVVDDGGENILQQDRYAAVVASLIAKGAPLDGIGLQAHISDHLTSPEQFLAVLDRFASYGKELKITEFDVAAESEATQADYTRDFLTAAFSHPAMNGVYLWGFWAGQHYRPEAALYRQDWTARPAADAWNDLIYRQWWSDVTGTTDASGAFHARVFYGDYDVDATIGATPVTQSLTYAPGSADTVSFGSFDIGPLSPALVRNAATLAAGPVSAGEQLLIGTRDFGPEPTTAAKADTNGRLPTSLAGRQVIVNGVAVPILETTATSIRCVLPRGLGAIASVQLKLFGKLTNLVYLPVADTVPGIFTTDGSGRGAALVYDDNGVALTSGVNAGSIVTVRATGLGLGLGVDSNQTVAKPLPLELKVGVLVGEAPAAVISANWISPGVAAVRFRVPESAKPGEAGLGVVAAAQASRSGVTLTIAQPNLTGIGASEANIAAR